MPGNVILYRKYLFSALSLVYLQPFVQGVVMTVAAKDVMAEMNLSPEGMGLLGSVYYYAYAPAMLGSGMLAAWLGPRRTMSAMFFISGAGGLLFCRSDSFFLACLGRALTGIGTSVAMTSSLTLFSRWFKGESYSFICGLFFALGGLGSFFGAGPLAILNVSWGWRGVFLLIALATLFFSALVFLTIRDWPPKGSETVLGIQNAPRDPMTLAVLLSGIRTMSRNRDFRKLALWFVSMAGIYMSFVGLWAVPYLKDVYRLSDGAAGLVVSMFSFGFIIGNPLASWICEKKLHSNRAGLGYASILGLAAFLPLYVYSGTLGYSWLLIISGILGIAINAPNVIVYSAVRNLFGARLTAVGSGALGSLCFVSGAAMQIVCGAILTFGESRGFTAAAAYALAFAPYFVCLGISIWAGFTLSHSCDPGQISPMSWRMILKEKP
ncbi:MAG: MFS transporter [Planctomycetota bacterium]|jgi:sugar phosphate permease|nr:MFS transporter [Planctomycetota bacterium]